MFLNLVSLTSPTQNTRFKTARAHACKRELSGKICVVGLKTEKDSINGFMIAKRICISPQSQGVGNLSSQFWFGGRI